MNVDWSKAAKDFFDQQPHPNGHGLKIGEYATAVKLASMLKFGGHAAGHEAALFWDEFQATGMAPQEFEHALERLAPLSFTYHGRPPTMQELVQLKDKLPHEVRKYFGDLPDQHYPSLSSHDMIATLDAARPFAQQYLGRHPLKNEAVHLFHSKRNPGEYYSSIASDRDQSREVPDTGGSKVLFGGNDRWGGVRNSEASTPQVAQIRPRNDPLATGGKG